ncbi:hypothetical protein PPYR_15597, partial [Photinus pyralis]
MEKRQVKAECQLCLPKIHIISGIIEKYQKYIQTKKVRLDQCKKKLEEGATTAGSSNENARILKKQTTIESSFYRGQRVSQDEFNKRLLTFIVNSMSSINTVENKYFIKLFDGMNLTVMTRKTAIQKINRLQEDSVESLVNKLKSVKYVCTTSDIWSAKKRSFLGVTCHWLDSNLKRHSAALACRRFQGTHSYNRIAEMLDEIHNKYELDSNKIVATVTDNGANFIKAFKEFGIDIPSELIFRNVNNENEIHTILDSNELGSTANSGNTDENNEIEDIDDVLPSFVSINSDYCDNQETSVMLQLPHHERCASHTLNLIAVTDVKNAIEKNHATRSRHTAIMAKCSLLWNKCSYPKSAEIVKDVLGHYLSYPGVTRWNSYYDSISQIVKEKNKLSELFLKLGLKNSLKESELAYLNEYCKVLEPLATALDKLQAENNNYYGYLLPCIVSLRTKFVKMQSANLKQTNHILDACLNGLKVRFKNLLTLTDEANNAIIAAFTIPQFKLRWYNGIKDTAIKSLQDINKIIVMAAKNVCAENETSDRSK